MHLDDEQIQRLLHGEISARVSQTREHVSRCAACESRLAAATREEAEIDELLGTLDSPSPLVSANAIARRARAAGLLPRDRRRSSWLRRAAAVLLAAGVATAAYAVPGSPVRTWIRAFVERAGSRAHPPAPSEPGDSRTDLSGIAMPPGGRLSIVFAQDGGEVLVSLTDGPDVEVQGPAEAGAFSTSADRLLVENRDGLDRFDIRIPRSAPWVEIRIGDDRLFLKDGSRITTVETADREGRYLLPLKPRRP